MKFKGTKESRRAEFEELLKRVDGLGEPSAGLPPTGVPASPETYYEIAHKAALHLLKIFPDMKELDMTQVLLDHGHDRATAEAVSLALLGEP